MSNNKHILSKSSFLKGLQCSKALYLYKYHYNLKDSVSTEDQLKFNNGTDVGKLARKLFLGGIDASPKTHKNFAPSIALTKKLINEGAEIIYEAAFLYNEVLAAMDIMVKKNNKWYAYEVKSSTRISQLYVQDAALQYYVMTQSGIEVEDISIITINNQYIREDYLDIQKLFSIRSVLIEVLEMQELIHQKIIELKEVLNLPFIPSQEIGEKCFQPYKCNFMGHCWKHIPTYSVFDIAGISREEQFSLYQEGIKRMADVPETRFTTQAQKVQIKSIKEQRPIIDHKGINQFLATIHYPIYFMDFESPVFSVGTP